jgi:hypothetical protein
MEISLRQARFFRELPRVMQVKSKLIVACRKLIFPLFQVMIEFLGSHHGKDIATVAGNPFVGMAAPPYHHRFPLPDSTVPNHRKLM